jgi:hypothetical protein
MSGVRPGTRPLRTCPPEPKAWQSLHSRPRELGQASGSVHKEVHRAGDAFVRLPTDLRRSECHSESHQPPALRTRCMRDIRACRGGGQPLVLHTSRKLRSFLLDMVRLRSSLLALDGIEEKKGAGPRGPGSRFAEPETLSSTCPTSVPLPRSTPRRASTYRRPVLCAGGNVRQSTWPCQPPPKRNSAQFAGAGRSPLTPTARW